MGLKFLAGIFCGRSLARALRRVTLKGFLGFALKLFNRILLLLRGSGIKFKFLRKFVGLGPEKFWVHFFTGNKF
jgi:hypothetical protein